MTFAKAGSLQFALNGKSQLVNQDLGIPHFYEYRYKIVQFAVKTQFYIV
jgi:hypothetical protein